ncbi:MAG: hypothetical protein ACE5OZ_07990 [Candidatus Heimdallarchaeota archaeon]
MIQFQLGNDLKFDRWYNKARMGPSGKQSGLFASKQQVQSLLTKIAKQEIASRQSRRQLYRLVGEFLSQFFSWTLLDPLIDDITALKTLRSPQTVDEAVNIVLAAIELSLRKNSRLILKEAILGELASELGIEIDRKNLNAAARLLAKSGFWKAALPEIQTTTYDILRSLTLEIILNYPFPGSDDVPALRRQLFQRCGTLINALAQTHRQPPALEIYAHAIVSHVAEKLLKTPIMTSQVLGDAHFNTSVYREKRQLLSARISNISNVPKILGDN